MRSTGVNLDAGVADLRRASMGLSPTSSPARRSQLGVTGLTGFAGSFEGALDRSNALDSRPYVGEGPGSALDVTPSPGGVGSRAEGTSFGGRAASLAKSPADLVVETKLDGFQSTMPSTKREEVTSTCSVPKPRDPGMQHSFVSRPPEQMAAQPLAIAQDPGNWFPRETYEAGEAVERVTGLTTGDHFVPTVHDVPHPPVEGKWGGLTPPREGGLTPPRGPASTQEGRLGDTLPEPAWAWSPSTDSESRGAVVVDGGVGLPPGSPGEAIRSGPPSSSEPPGSGAGPAEAKDEPAEQPETLIRRISSSSWRDDLRQRASLLSGGQRQLQLPAQKEEEEEVEDLVEAEDLEFASQPESDSEVDLE